jgi:1-acyl-sn-glycerol-3-phosphate acyltransferase
MSGADSDRLIPARPSKLMTNWFVRYVNRLFRRRFHTFGIAREGLDSFRQIELAKKPAIILLNHASWWDPLVGVMLAKGHVVRRPLLAPIDREQLERFKFFRKLGFFGIDPEDPRSLEDMFEYVTASFQSTPQTWLWLTPQGQFTDVRKPVRIRPGAAKIAASTPDIDVMSLAIEYAFWQDSKPEVLVRFARIEPQQTTTSGWQRAMTEGMQANADALSRLVQDRDIKAFERILGSGTRNAFIYDLYLRLRGRHGEIEARRESAEQVFSK